MARRKQYPLRIDPELWTAIERWANDELRSVNGQIEFMLRDSLKNAGRLPSPPKGNAGQRKAATPGPRAC